MPEALIFDNISYTKMEPLTADEIRLMKNKVSKQLKIYVPGYSILTVLAIWILVRGPAVLPMSTIDEKTIVLFWTAAPYFCLFLFLATTTLLLSYYFRSVRPLIKDIKGRKKITVFYRPKKTAM